MHKRITDINVFLGTTLLGATVLSVGTCWLQSQAFSPQVSPQSPTQVEGSPANVPLANAHLSMNGLELIANGPITRTSQRFTPPSAPSTSPKTIVPGLYPSASPSTPIPNDGNLSFPLIHTDVKANVQGNVARVELTQTFENPFDEPLEAIYVFPLPDEAAVDDMNIRVGDRIISGDIKEREEAQAIYEQAVQEGRTAGLLEQERANIFTQSLANIRPGERIDVTIRYTESLTFEGNNYEFVFPMVVGPRYIPGNPVNETGDTDQVPDASRITPPVLEPGTRSGHDIAVAITIDAGVPIQSIESPSHKLQMTPGDNDSTVQVNLAPNDTIPNKDLILRYQVSGDETQTTLLTDTTEQGGHFALYLVPAVDYDRDEIVPKDVVFLMDTSGSQSGDPIAKSQELMRRMVNGLNPDDTFSIIDFANTTTRLSDNPLENTARNRSQAIDYINALSANGGTELLNGIREVLTFPAARRDRLRSIVLLTDGYIGNEADVIAEVQAELEPGNRLYSFGVGSGVNRFLIDRLAEVGRGTSQVIRHDEPSGPVAEQFFQQINNPVLTNVQVEWMGDGAAPEIYPGAAPDLFTQQPLVIFGRKPDGLSGTLKVTGTMAGGKRYEQTIPVNFSQDDGTGAIAQLWGRSRIKDLMNQMYRGETVSGVEGITETALAYRLLSQYTAFVAVSEEVRVDPDGTRRTVEVPVELPEGVSYDGIFGPSDPQGPPGQFAPPAVGRPSARSTGASRGNSRLQSLSRPAPASASAPAPAIAPIPSLPPSGVASTLDLDEEAIAPEPVVTPITEIRITQLDGPLSSSLQSDLEDALAAHLQYFSTTTEQRGEVVWQIRVLDGRIIQVLWDDRLSTIDEQMVVDSMRRMLQTWTLNPDTTPSSLTGTLRITVEL